MGPVLARAADVSLSQGATCNSNQVVWSFTVDVLGCLIGVFGVTQGREEWKWKVELQQQPMRTKSKEARHCMDDHPCYLC